MRFRRRTTAAFFCGLWALCIALAGCGTAATPVLQRATATPVQVKQAPATATSAPTITPLPPTATPTPLPSETPTPVPSPTPEPSATPVLSPIDRLVASRDAEAGAILFETFQESAGSGYSCANCHLADSEKTNLGPGLLNIKDRAAARVQGMTAAEYIYESIVDSQAYTVADFDPELMPQNWAEIYSDFEIFDIVAYLMTLEGESDIDEPDLKDEDDSAEASG